MLDDVVRGGIGYVRESEYREVCISEPPGRQRPAGHWRRDRGLERSSSTERSSYGCGSQAVSSCDRSKIRATTCAAGSQHRRNVSPDPTLVAARYRQADAVPHGGGFASRIHDVMPFDTPCTLTLTSRRRVALVKIACIVITSRLAMWARGTDRASAAEPRHAHRRRKIFAERYSGALHAALATLTRRRRRISPVSGAHRWCSAAGASSRSTARRA